MPKLMVIYYSRTGNTEKMAKAIVEGAKDVHGVDAELKVDYEVAPEELLEIEAILIGTPTHNHDMTRNVKKLLEEISVKGIDLKGKVGTSFGSYGWSGEAPNLILEFMEKKFGMKIIKPPLLIKYTPSEKGLEECRKLGKNVAEEIAKRPITH